MSFRTEVLRGHVLFFLLFVYMWVCVCMNKPSDEYIINIYKYLKKCWYISSFVSVSHRKVRSGASKGGVGGRDVNADVKNDMGKACRPQVPSAAIKHI